MAELSYTVENSEGEKRADLEKNDNFQVRTVKQTFHSVTIHWNNIPDADVYRIEKFHRITCWNRVGCCGGGPFTIDNLDENFSYRIRITALAYPEHTDEYVELLQSLDHTITTLSAPPTTKGLFLAIKRGQQFLAKQMLRRRSSLIEYPGPNGYLPLANAIWFVQTGIVDFLLTAGANVHVGNPKNGRTPLHVAFYCGHLSVARMLLNKRAELDATDANGMTASHFAIDANLCDMLKFALENGANIEASDSSGWTLLMRAVVMRSDIGIIKLLIMQGADISAVDWIGQTCIDLARLYEYEEATNYFQRLTNARSKMKQ